MKRILLFISFFVSLFATAQIDKAIPAKPSPPKLVNDFTNKDKQGNGFLTAGQAAELERKLVAYDDSTSNQIAIVIVEDLQGYDANQFATAIGDKWGVGGSKDYDNGIVILVSTGGGEGNRDAYIAVGRGLEGAIPDMTAGAIVDHELIPNFKEGNYYRGLDETVDALIKAAAGEYQAPQNYGSRNSGDWKGLSKAIVLIVVLLVIFLVAGGGSGGGYVSRGGYTGWSGGSSGGWSGGSSSGGFGGFGGGSFGGGGAGGKW